VSAEPLPLSPQTRPRRSTARQPGGRATLALVPPAAHARRAPFVALLLVLLAGGLVGLLLLNTASAQDAFRLHSLQSQQAAIAQQQQAYTGTADGLDDPARLAARAAALGLVPGGVPVFLLAGQPLPKGAIRLGNLVYVPGAVPVLPVVPVTPPPAAPAKQPVAKQPVAKQPVAKKPVAKQQPAAKQPVTAPTATSPISKAAATGTRTPAAAQPVTGKPAAPIPLHKAAVAPAPPVAGTTGATKPAAGARG
jgi:hypothetical protein